MPLSAMIRMGLMAAMLAAVTLALPTESFAQPTGAPAAGAAASVPVQPPATCDGYVGLMHHMAGCIRDTIAQSADKFFDDVYPALRAAIAGILTLAVVVYGVMLSMGMVEKLGRDTFVLLLKIAAISFFVTSSPFTYTTIIGAMDGASAAVVSYTPPSGPADNAGSDYNQSVCMKNMIEAQGNADPSKPVITPWLAIDCLIDSVIGIKILPKAGGPAVGDEKWFNTALDSADPTKSSQGLARGLIFFFFSSLQTSILGAVLALVAFFFVYGLLWLIVRVFFGYIAGYMGVALLVILSPLFIPLILFRDTKQYFDKWVKLLIGFTMQPILMLVFVIFSITAVDFAAFSGNYSIVYRIAGDASRTTPFSLNEYLTKQRNASGGEDTSSPPCETCGPIVATKDKPLAAVKAAPKDADKDTKPPIESKDKGGVVDDLNYSACTDKNMKADKSGALKKFCDAQYTIRLQLKNIDWDKMAAARTPAVSADGGATPGQQIAREVLSAVFFCCMVVFILNGMLVVVTSIILDLVGDSVQSPDLNTAFGSGFGGKQGGGIAGILNRATAPLKRGGR